MEGHKQRRQQVVTMSQHSPSLVTLLISQFQDEPEITSVVIPVHTIISRGNLLQQEQSLPATSICFQEITFYKYGHKRDNFYFRTHSILPLQKTTSFSFSNVCLKLLRANWLDTSQKKPAISITLLHWRVMSWVGKSWITLRLRIQFGFWLRSQMYFKAANNFAVLDFLRMQIPLIAEDHTPRRHWLLHGFKCHTLCLQQM